MLDFNGLKQFINLLRLLVYFIIATWNILFTTSSLICKQYVYNHFFSLNISRISTTDITIRPNANA